MRSRTEKKPKSDSNTTDQPPLSTQPVAERRPTVIGASLQFNGEIKSAGSVTIDGWVKGRVTAGSLTLGSRGGIEGDVAAETAYIDGLLEGDLEAGSVTLGPNARVHGDITHRSLAMEPGAQFEGRSVTASDAGTKAKTLTPSKAAGD